MRVNVYFHVQKSYQTRHYTPMKGFECKLLENVTELKWKVAWKTDKKSEEEFDAYLDPWESLED